MFLTEKVFAEQVEFGARFNFHVAVNCHLASEPHGFFVADKGQAGHGVQSAGCDRRRDWHAKASLFYQAHFAGVFHAGHNLNTTSAALRESMAIEDFIEPCAEPIEALVGVDTRLDGFLTQIRPFGNFDLFFLFYKFDDRHLNHALSVGISFELGP